LAHSVFVMHTGCWQWWWVAVTGWCNWR